MNKTEFVEKEIERTRGDTPYVLLGIALVANFVILGKTEPLVIGIFLAGAILGAVSGYKFAFDRIKRK